MRLQTPPRSLPDYGLFPSATNVRLAAEGRNLPVFAMILLLLRLRRLRYTRPSPRHPSICNNIIVWRRAASSLSGLLYLALPIPRNLRSPLVYGVVAKCTLNPRAVLTFNTPKIGAFCFDLWCLSDRPNLNHLPRQAKSQIWSLNESGAPF